MGKGRPRKATADLKLHGGFRHHLHGDRGNEPQPGGEPVPSFPLAGDAREMWERVVPQLIECGIATAVDGDDLTAMCEWWKRFRKIQKVLDKTGVANDNHAKLMRQMDMASNNFAKLSCKFGMNPSDRTRLNTGTSKQTKPDEVGARSRA